MLVTRGQYYVICILLLCLAVASYLLLQFYDSQELPAIFTILVLLCTLLPALYLYRYGTLRHTAWRYPVWALLCIGCAGGIAASYWGTDWSGLVILTTYTLLPLTYALYFFIRKRRRRLSDWLKLLWVLVNYGISALVVAQLLRPDVWYSFSVVLLLYATLTHFHFVAWRKMTDEFRDSTYHWDFEQSLTEPAV